MKGAELSKSFDINIVKNIKEWHCYLSTSYEKELIDYKQNAKKKEISYTLPDGQTIHLGSELI